MTAFDPVLIRPFWGTDENNVRAAFPGSATVAQFPGSVPARYFCCGAEPGEQQ